VQRSHPTQSKKHAVQNAAFSWQEEPPGDAIVPQRITAPRIGTQAIRSPIRPFRYISRIRVLPIR
jgi:hypothetical protein